jgi:exo-1,4-beta-D-glucosaminidase
LSHFTPALEARLGNATSPADYLLKAQVQAYESHRAMFEAYSGAKYTSTGVIQWMLNNGWPEMM